MISVDRSESNMVKGFLAAPSVVRVSEKFSLGVKVLGDVYNCPPACYYPKPEDPITERTI